LKEREEESEKERKIRDGGKEEVVDEIESVEEESLEKEESEKNKGELRRDNGRDGEWRKEKHIRQNESKG
jgi:hypothetical protein